MGWTTKFLTLKRGPAPKADPQERELRLYADEGGALRTILHDGTDSPVAGAGALPNPTNEGDVLTVASGEWAGEPPSGGSMTVPGIYGDGSDGAQTVDADDYNSPETVAALAAADPWASGHVYAAGDLIKGGGYIWAAYLGFTSGTVEPDWAAAIAGANGNDGPGSYAYEDNESDAWIEQTPGAVVQGKLWRNGLFQNLTIDDNVDLEANGFQLFVRDTLTLNGADAVFCADGSTASWTGPSDQRAYILGVPPHGGDAGGGNADDPFGIAFGGLAGNGGDSTLDAGDGGLAGNTPAIGYADRDIFVRKAQSLIRSLPTLLLPSTVSVAFGITNVFDGSANRILGGRSGGGGADDPLAAATGGISGRGGAVASVIAQTIAGTGVIRAKGGDGADATDVSGGDAGGGGAGGGGLCLVVCQSIAGTVTVSAPGGNGGAPVGAGIAGEDGEDGLVVVLTA